MKRSRMNCSGFAGGGFAAGRGHRGWPCCGNDFQFRSGFTGGFGGGFGGGFDGGLVVSLAVLRPLNSKTSMFITIYVHHYLCLSLSHCLSC